MDRQSSVTQGFAIADVLQSRLLDLKTEPMPRKTLARYFGVDPRTFSKHVLPKIEAEPVGNLWRVKLADMPPAYFLEIGLMIQNLPSAN